MESASGLCSVGGVGRCGSPELRASLIAYMRLYTSPIHHNKSGTRRKGGQGRSRAYSDLGGTWWCEGCVLRLCLAGSN